MTHDRVAVALLIVTLGTLAAVGWGVSRPDSKRSAGSRPAARSRSASLASPVPTVPLPLRALTNGGRQRHHPPPGETRRYTLPLSTDQYLHLVVDQFGVDIAATIRDPSGQRLLRVDGPTEDKGPEDLFLVARAAGLYLLEVTSPEEADGGRYEVRVEALRVADDDDRDRAAAAAAFSTARLSQRAETGFPEAAATGYRDAARLWRKVGDEEREAWALYRLGKMYCDDSGRCCEATAVLERAVQLFGEVSRPKQQALSLYYLGEARACRGDLDSAAGTYEQALTSWEQQGNRFEQATTLNSLAIVRRYQGRTHTAIDLFSRAVEIWHELREWGDLATTHANLGVLYVSLGESRLALEQYRRALAFLERKPDPLQMAVILSKQGDVLLGMGRPEEALARYEEALALRRRWRAIHGEGITLNGIGRVSLALNRPREALQALRSAEQIFRRVGDEAAQAAVSRNLGDAYRRLGLLGQARERYQQALRLSPGEERAFFGLARVARAEGKLEEAERWMDQTLAAIEAARDQVWRLDLRSSYLASRQEQYAFYIDLLAERHRREPDRGHDARAFAISERARARSLLDLLTVASQRPDPEEVRRVGELSRQVNTQHLDVLASSQGIEDGALGSDLSDLLERLRQAEAEAHGPLTSERATPPTLSLAQVQAELIDGETLLLEYFLGEERSFLWAVTSEETRFSILPGREEIEQAARQAYRRMLESHHQTGEIAARQAASRLSRMLLGPVADLLDRRRLVLVAPGSLQSVPFAALYHPQPGGRVAAQPLIAEHEIVSLPSASVLATLRTRTVSRRPPPGLLAVVADPVFGPDDERLQGLRRGGEADRARPSRLVTPWQRLRYTGREAEAILALAGSRSVLAASGFAANRDLVRSGRLGSYRVLHFATHGLLNDLYPELSALALSAFDASGRPVDGHLRAYEISDLDLRADLVVLSACRTGLGKEVGGEGLVGLTQGFLHAGAPRLLVSLWDVDDRATGELMKHFYTGLFLQHLPPAQALRQAQLSLSREKRWRAPYYWAGFTLQGEWR